MDLLWTHYGLAMDLIRIKVQKSLSKLMEGFDRRVKKKSHRGRTKGFHLRHIALL